MQLSPHRLRELFTYDPETGIFTRNISRGSARRGRATGGLTRKGYLRFKVDGKHYLAHRLAWLYVHGEWPKNQIDHRDGDKENNSLVNLRDVSQTVNQYNKTSPRKDNKTGVQGVGAIGKSFRARITIGGKVMELGTFKTVEEAHKVYVNAKLNIHMS